ncbi:hypothetical protein LWI29_027470 [Acer saccharum]|uniref:Uncharacterized protein n=1 Tax=Acer saccharum TaxID=4024 RepID=A0AA39TSM7_ACESA|nr:hypothetical protein LWI29_027470 [Acer saccharum]
MSTKGNVIGQSKLAGRSKGLFLKKYTDKGKKKWCRRKVVRPKVFAVQNGKLVLEKRGGSDQADCVRRFETSSSSEEDLGEKAGKAEMSGPSLSSKPKKVTFCISSEGPSILQNLKANERVDLCVDLGQMLVSPMNESNSTGVIFGIESEPAEGGSSLDSLATKEASVQAAIEVESLVQSLREGDQEESEEVEVISSDI